MDLTVRKYRCTNPGCGQWGVSVAVLNDGDHCSSCKKVLSRNWVSNDRLVPRKPVEQEVDERIMGYVPGHADFQVVDSHNISEFEVSEVPDGDPGPPSKIEVHNDLDIFRTQAQIDMHMKVLVNMAQTMRALYCYDRLTELWREMNSIAVEYHRGCNG